MNNSIDRHRKGDIADGSLTDMAAKYDKSIAEAFIDCDAVVLIDSSSSMAACDVRENDRRYSRFHAACDELRRLQRELPGKIAVVSFGTDVAFCPSGVPSNDFGGTNMHKALEFVKRVDGCGVRIIIVSDGEPNSEDETLRVASSFTTKIDTIFIGPDNDPGARFLKKLARATGGKASRTATDQMDNLSKTVRGLLTA